MKYKFLESDELDSEKKLIETVTSVERKEVFTIENLKAAITLRQQEIADLQAKIDDASQTLNIQPRV